MNSHGPEGRKARGDTGFEPSVRVAEIEGSKEREDVLFDFSDLDHMRVQDLTLLLTARGIALENERAVWAAGVPLHTWRTLQAMGLGGFFKPFPTFGDVEDA